VVTLSHLDDGGFNADAALKAADFDSLEIGRKSASAPYQILRNLNKTAHKLPFRAANSGRGRLPEISV
jgi:hypothetical protein